VRSGSMWCGRRRYRVSFSLVRLETMLIERNSDAMFDYPVGASASSIPSACNQLLTY
jgi:hypothetical protein